MSVLELNHVKKSFNNGTLHVLKDISLSVEKGEVVAIIGPAAAANPRCCAAPRCSSASTPARSALTGIRRAHWRRRHRRLRRQGGAQADPQLFRPRFPAVQSLPALLCAQKRYGRAHLRAEARPRGGRGVRAQDARKDGPRRQGRRLSVPALRRPAAARGHRPRAGDEPGDTAFRRADLRARPGADGRGAEGDPRSRRGTHDHGHRDARDAPRVWRTA